MKICVVGTGAIGGLVAAGLAETGSELTLIDVGPQLEALRDTGLTVLQDGRPPRTTRAFSATDSFVEAGVQDVVILGLKAYDIAGVAADMRALYGPDTVLVTLQNGIPWWYFQRYEDELEGWRLDSVDPRGLIADSVETERILGCVAYPAACLEQPGVVRHIYGLRFPVGELDGGDTPRLRSVVDMFRRAGFESRATDDIRAEIWLKEVGALAFNSIGALTRATMADVCAHPALRGQALDLMHEAGSVAEGLGVRLRVSLDKRMRGAERVGHHRTSMLQDVEAGRRLEVGAVVGSVVEIGRRLGIPTPRIEQIEARLHALDRRRAGDERT